MKAWSKTMGILAVSSGESELAAIIRAATKVLAYSQFWVIFNLIRHVVIKSDASAAIGMVHRKGLGKSGIWPLEVCGSSSTSRQGEDAGTGEPK